LSKFNDSKFAHDHDDGYDHLTGDAPATPDSLPGDVPDAEPAVFVLPTVEEHGGVEL